jgi:hypothetical protein
MPPLGPRLILDRDGCASALILSAWLAGRIARAWLVGRLPLAWLAGRQWTKTRTLHALA